jgi:uncharacterized integral membrane protein (TIGR00697 family)
LGIRKGAVDVDGNQLDSHALEERRFKLYGFLVALFACSLVTGNLVFQKCVTIVEFESILIELSVGLFYFPLTYLIGNMISEIFGKNAADTMVRIGFCCSIIVALIVRVADYLSATSWSPVNDQVFHQVFGNFSWVFLISLCSWGLSQLLDIRIYLKLKRLTHGRALWLRNITSLFVAQGLDTCLVVLMLVTLDIFPASKFGMLVKSGFLFKASFSLCCVPLYYGAIAFIQYWLRRPLPILSPE